MEDINCFDIIPCNKVNPLELFGLVSDIDRKVLLHIRDDKIFRALILVNKYLSQVFTEYSWYQRFTNKYGFDLNRYGKINYKALYLRLSHHTINNNFKYVTQKGYLELVEYYIQLRSKIKAQFNYDKSMKISCSNGHIPLVKYFNSYSVNVTSYMAREILYNIVRYNYLDVVKYFTTHIYLSFDHRVYYYAILYAIQLGHLEMIKWLHKCIRNVSDLYFIRAAIKYNKPEILEYYLNKNSNYDINEIIIKTIISGNLEILKYFHAHYNDDGRVFSQIIKHNCIELVKYFFPMNSLSIMPEMLKLAMRSDYLEIVQFFHDNGIK